LPGEQDSSKDALSTDFCRSSRPSGDCSDDSIGMKILFLDQSGQLGGAELCLCDIAKAYRDTSLVGLFSDGSFKTLLEQANIPVQILTTAAIDVRKESGLLKGATSLKPLLPLIAKTAQIARNYDLIYANTQKALVVGAIASFWSGRPLVYHLHDILSADHFSPTNRRLAVLLANRFASRVIANSEASQAAFVKAGGNPALTQVIYNGFELSQYQHQRVDRTQLRQQLGLDQTFLVGHFSRLSPWKGQHILIEALARCPESVTALFVGDALFGEENYAQFLREQVKELGLEQRVRFLGFRSDVMQLMTACDLVAHTSTAPEPFGRVIVEAMLCGRPVVAAAAGGAVELVEAGKTGWLCKPGDPQQLTEAIEQCFSNPQQAEAVGRAAQEIAQQRFDQTTINCEIEQLLKAIAAEKRSI